MSQILPLSLHILMSSIFSPQRCGLGLGMEHRLHRTESHGDCFSKLIIVLMSCQYKEQVGENEWWCLLTNGAQSLGDCMQSLCLRTVEGRRQRLTCKLMPICCFIHESLVFMALNSVLQGVREDVNVKRQTHSTDTSTLYHSSIKTQHFGRGMNERRCSHKNTPSGVTMEDTQLRVHSSPCRMHNSRHKPEGIQVVALSGWGFISYKKCGITVGDIDGEGGCRVREGICGKCLQPALSIAVKLKPL